MLGASSIMNTEDKLYSDGGNEMNSEIDVFTDHYVVPRGCYGPMVARARGKSRWRRKRGSWALNIFFPKGLRSS